MIKKIKNNIYLVGDMFYFKAGGLLYRLNLDGLYWDSEYKFDELLKVNFNEKLIELDFHYSAHNWYGGIDFFFKLAGVSVEELNPYYQNLLLLRELRK